MRFQSVTGLQYFSLACAGYATLGGALCLCGWILGAERLTDWTGAGIAMKANAALCAGAGGAALLMHVLNPSARGWVRLFGACVAALGAATLFEHFTSLNLGIDTVFFDEPPGATATAAPGRMGPPASSSFFALGAALILCTSNSRARHAVSVGCSILVVALSTLSFVGYWYGAEEIYMLPRLTGIALQTVSMIMALAIGIIADNPDVQPMATLREDSNAGVLARRVVPLAFVVPLGLGWLRLRGERAGLYDAAFGTAVRSVLEVAILSALLWAALRAVRARDESSLKAQQRENESKRLIAETLESITDGCVALDARGHFTFVNAEAERLLGRRRRDMIGQQVWDLFPVEPGSVLYGQLERAWRDRERVEYEGPGLPADDREFMNRAYPVASGGIVLYFQDISARKRAERALQEADRRKDEFIATLAHELRNPLAPIRNATEIILVRGLGDQTQKRAAEIIGRQVRHMTRLLDDLLDVSRISRNRLDLRRESLELAPIIYNAVEASRPAIAVAGHALTVDLPPEPVYLLADGVRLTQVICNLLNNSAKYTDGAGNIGLNVEIEPSSVHIHVRDNGAGVAPEMLHRIFDMFTQADPGSLKARSGLGLGLALARGIVELHGGKIEALSAGIGTGTRVTVTLPRLIPVGLSSVNVAIETTEQMTPRRVVVVDDLHDNADSLSMLLETMGHEVRTAYDGAKALEVTAEFRPDVVFLDLGMPGTDGITVCRAIRATDWGHSVVVVAVTGWGQAEDRRITQRAGFDHHLTKPADARLLSRMLAELPS